MEEEEEEEEEEELTRGSLFSWQLSFASGYGGSGSIVLSLVCSAITPNIFFLTLTLWYNSSLSFEFTLMNWPLPSDYSPSCYLPDDIDARWGFSKKMAQDGKALLLSPNHSPVWLEIKVHASDSAGHHCWILDAGQMPALPSFDDWSTDFLYCEAALHFKMSPKNAFDTHSDSRWERIQDLFLQSAILFTLPQFCPALSGSRIKFNSVLRPSRYAQQFSLLGISQPAFELDISIPSPLSSPEHLNAIFNQLSSFVDCCSPIMPIVQQHREKLDDHFELDLYAELSAKIEAFKINTTCHYPHTPKKINQL